MSATITYRQLDGTGDPIWGGGQSNFIADLNAVAQAISTRLKLLQGEWWESLNTGTPLFQSMLGIGGSGKQPGVMALILTQRILSTPYVLSVDNVVTSYDATLRSFAFACTAKTRFGTVTVTTQPQPGSKAALS
jgi:hypothetical protein